MHYTVAVIEDVQCGQRVNFDHVGNKYLVGLYEEETKTYVHKTYASMEEAYSVFEKLSKAIITSCYSFEQRKQFL